MSEDPAPAAAPPPTTPDDPSSSSSSSSTDEEINQDFYRSGEFGIIGGEQADETHYDTRRPRPSTATSATATTGTATTSSTTNVPISEVISDSFVVSTPSSNEEENDNDETDGDGGQRINFPQDKIYGREEELTILQQVYKKTRVGDDEDDDDGDGPQIVFLSGYAGSGKTRLVKEALKRFVGMQQEEGDSATPPPIFIHGKYEELQTGDLYKGISKAFADWFYHHHQSISSSYNHMDSSQQQQSSLLKQDFVSQLEDAIGDDVAVLEEIIPGLLHNLSGDSTSSVSSRSSSKGLLLQNAAGVDINTLNKSRIHYIFTSFVKTICSYSSLLLLPSTTATTTITGETTTATTESPPDAPASPPTIILFLDDLQWANVESLQLLESILTDSTIPSNFMFVGSYRSNEVHQEHPLTTVLIDEMEMSCKVDEDNITTIHLKDLTKQQLTLFIGDTLDMDTTSPQETAEDAFENLEDMDDELEQQLTVQPLADAIFSKTLGNIFFTMQALEQLVRKNVLYYDMMIFKWQWATDQLASSSDILSNDVVEMIKSKIEEDMSPQLHKILVVAANLSRSTFDLRTLEDATNTDIYGPRLTNHNGTIQKLLDDAVIEGLLYCNHQHQHNNTTTLAPPPPNTIGNDNENNNNHTTDNDNNNYTYTFFHDRIREAAGSLVEGETRDRLLFHIGKVLAEKVINKTGGGGGGNGSSDAINQDGGFGGGGEEDWMLFTAVHHLNSVPSHYHDKYIPNNGKTKWKITMATLNMETAKASMAMAAFSQAATYSEQGIHYLPSSSSPSAGAGDNNSSNNNDNDEKWTSPLYRDLSRELYATAAEAFRLTGDIEKMEQYSNELLLNVQESSSKNNNPSHDDKIFKVRYNLAVGLFYGAERHEEALKIMLDLLAKLNCKFPKSTVQCVSKTIGHMVGLPFAKNKRTDKELQKVEFMERSDIFKCMIILDKLFELCYLMKNETLLPLVIFRAHEYTIKHGLCMYSPKLFAAIALFYSEALNDLNGAAVYANYALGLMKKVNHRPIECGTLMIAYFFGLHWTVPVRECIEPMKRAYLIGTKTGELENPMWCIFNYFLFSFQAGVSLDKIEAAIVQYLPEMEEKSLNQIVVCATSFWNLTLTLMGRSDANSDQMGSETNERISEIPVANLIAAAGTRIKQGYFGDYENCAESGIKAGSDVRKAAPGGPIPVMDMCVCALSCYVMAQRTGKARYTKEAKSIHKCFKGWTKQGNPNIRHWKLLLDAEQAALKGPKQKKVVMDKYQSAIRFAKDGGYIHDAAIGYERLGEYMLQILSEKQEAAVNLKESLRLWREWGAVGKVERMMEKYSNLLGETKTT